MKITMFKAETKNGVETRTVKNITEDFYRNYIASIPFFDRWGKEGSGYCRGRKSSTPYGKMITDVTTVDPWGTTTIKAHFQISTDDGAHWTE